MSVTTSQPASNPSPSGKGQSRALVWPLAVFVLLAAIFALALWTGDPSKLPSALIGKTTPDIVQQPLEGLGDSGRPIAGLASADLAKGQVSVVNFWASWCIPCAQEHPLLLALKERTGAHLYGVNYKDQTAAALRFLARYGNPFIAVRMDSNGRAGIEWGVYGIPETFVVNGKGEIVYKHVGPITPETLDRDIIPAIRSAHARSN
jgi:cytochrome c biogenesis protein CcmG, thiol:disulfide interchange protein DsbE